MRRLFAVCLMLCILMGTTACTPWLADTETTHPESHQTTENTAGTLAPDFTVVDGEGTSVTLSEQRGKPVVVNLWASWCPPCKAEMPHFEQAYQENPDVVFMMVNLAVSDRREDAQSFLDQSGYTFPVYYDLTGQAAAVYNVSSIPMTLFIDASGNLVSYKVGMLNEQELADNIARIAA